MVRATIIFHGRVQGVGFRWTTQRTAAGYDVTGFVRNEPNGSVRVVAEGRREEIQAFAAGLRRRMTGHIDDESIQWTQATGEFQNFSIAR